MTELTTPPTIVGLVSVGTCEAVYVLKMMHEAAGIEFCTSSTCAIKDCSTSNYLS